ncbi:hypothetical protein AVEN_270494-1 [Araneus ventricosus]|uniref:Uncharacterized protein n=1 Tax=Araneus ventricosus TaxID=182803 RepID=A0A4Y2B704_ARAVE|nr:hypothetical protein AVEN_270494-1 [Araneus ventricosus]
MFSRCILHPPLQKASSAFRLQFIFLRRQIPSKSLLRKPIPKKVKRQAHNKAHCVTRQILTPQSTTKAAALEFSPPFETQGWSLFLGP